jgi:uncharacterized YigZ family protein
LTSLRDHYRTLADPAEGQIKIERSLFVGIASPVTSEDDFFAQLARIQKRYFDATHHCWAFRLFLDGEGRVRSSDAGEPGGTAGKPILSTLEASDLWDVSVVVVRYYGGVKLGTGGLGRAYREAAASALAAATVRDRYQYTRFTVVVPHPSISVAYRLVAPPDVLLVGEQYGEANELTFDVRSSRADAFEAALRARRLEFARPAGATGGERR